MINIKNNIKLQDRVNKLCIILVQILGFCINMISIKYTNIRIFLEVLFVCQNPIPKFLSSATSFPNLSISKAR